MEDVERPDLDDRMLSFHLVISGKFPKEVDLLKSAGIGTSPGSPVHPASDQFELIGVKIGRRRRKALGIEVGTEILAGLESAATGPETPPLCTWKALTEVRRMARMRHDPVSRRIQLHESICPAVSAHADTH